MCAIVDANVAHEVFGSNLPNAGARFFDWIENGTKRLVVGGKLREELEQSSEDFRKWARVAVRTGKIRIVNNNDVDERARGIEETGGYKSDDPHILALAQVSGARLLYSNDGNLQEDFGNKDLIDHPRGKVYSTRVNKDFQSEHRRLLANRSLCRPPG